MIYRSSYAPSIRLEYIYENCQQPKALFACLSRNIDNPLAGKVGVAGYLEAEVNFKLTSFDFSATTIVKLKDLMKGFSELVNISSSDWNSTKQYSLFETIDAYLSLPNKI